MIAIYEAKFWFSRGNFTNLEYCHTSAHPIVFDHYWELSNEVMQRRGSTLRLWNFLSKIIILLHKSRSQRFILNAFVCSWKQILYLRLKLFQIPRLTVSQKANEVWKCNIVWFCIWHKSTNIDKGLNFHNVAKKCILLVK